MTPQRVHFVVGVSRCGITPLSRCLNTHPDIAVFGESRFWGRCYVEPETAAGYSRGQVDQITETLVRHEWGATLGGGPGCLANLTLESWRSLLASTLADLETPVPPGSLFLALAEALAAAEDKTLVLEKTPHHLNWLDRIGSHLPESRFVVLVADPYIFARQQSRQEPPFHPIATALLWRGYLRAYERALERHDDRLVTVDCSELVERPGDALERIQRFLGVRVHDLAGPLEGGGFLPGGHRRDCLAEETFWLNVLAGRLVERHGYERRPTPLTPWPVLRSLASVVPWSARMLPLLRERRYSAPYLRRWLAP